MDMSVKTTNEIWLFPDSPSLPQSGYFEDCKLEISKNGSTQFPVITLDNAGQKIKLSGYRVNTETCLKKYGKDSDGWKGKLFIVSAVNGKLFMHPAESDIQ